MFGAGGARHPASGERLVAARRPGMELVISAHKSVAELGVIGRAEHMHQIMDAERDATLEYLDRVTRQMGGRRGRAAVPTATGGLVYAHTRHATSRAGDPCPHDHVLLANLVEMRDERGGWKAADTALWREHLHAATMIGRAASARAAVELGYGIDADPGPSGRLGHWRIAGVPKEVLEVHSKRAAEITAECQRRGDTSYRARGVAARTTRASQRPRRGGGAAGASAGETSWTASAGRPSAWTAIDQAAGADRRFRPVWTCAQARQILSEVLAPDGELARRKVFARRDVIVAVAPHLYGQDPRLVEAAGGPGVGRPRSHPPGRGGRRPGTPHTLASVLARETAIADSLARQFDRADAPAIERPSSRRPSPLSRPGWAAACRASKRQQRWRSARRGGEPSWWSGWPAPGKTTMLAGRRGRLRRRRLPGGRDGHLRPGRPHPRRRSRHRESRDAGQPDLAARPRPAAPWMTAAW